MGLCQSEAGDYDLDSKRTRKRKTFHDESKHNNDTCILDWRQDMIVNKFYPIINNISSELKNRSKIYFNQNEVFGFIYSLFPLKNEEIRE